MDIAGNAHVEATLQGGWIKNWVPSNQECISTNWCMLKFENHCPNIARRKTFEAEKESILMEIIKDFIDDEPEP